MARGWKRQEPCEGSSDWGAPGHQADQDQSEGQRSHHLDERVSGGEGGSEHESVQQADDSAEKDAREEGNPVGRSRVLDQVVGDQGARGADGAERDVQNARCLVQDDQADAGQGIHPAQRQPKHDIRLEELPVHAEDRESDNAMHRFSRTP